ncbi:hypothetical protein G3I59_36745 [Amycolatopsis rubida]|uniref:Scaffolding protein n=1 Tax=Amycolatopsis rubida TaxID=112413 RepID=A0ABX0C101_9PSEU|nr:MULTISPECIES: hypothetical protein [Amycolatopsis]MYW96008.1 hypothetical protein [Amycolatopsis rubida]NEC60999.1 hypothetical protein [Amycolatopsis rubida]OAP20561.1 hypothetical protein A4R44_08721 [Amycolatopsis sp. M39]
MPEAPAAEPAQAAAVPADPATPVPPVAAQPEPAAEPPAEPAELATLREQAEQLTEQAAAAKQRAEAAELDLARLTVIRTAQLPDALAARLNGATAEELTADAAELAGVISALVTTAAPPARTATGRPPVEALRPAASAPAEPVEDTPEQISRLVWGK